MHSSRDPRDDAKVISTGLRIFAALTPGQIRDMKDPGPILPSTPGLYALMAPDGITVKVFEGMLAEAERRYAELCKQRGRSR